MSPLNCLSALPLSESEDKGKIMNSNLVSFYRSDLHYNTIEIQDAWYVLDGYEYLKLLDELYQLCKKITASGKDLSSSDFWEIDPTFIQQARSSNFLKLFKLHTFLSEKENLSRFLETLKPVEAWLQVLKCKSDKLLLFAVRNDPTTPCQYNGFRSLFSVVKIVLIDFKKSILAFSPANYKVHSSFGSLLQVFNRKVELLSLIITLFEIIYAQSWLPGTLFSGKSSELVDFINSLNFENVLESNMGFQFDHSLKRTFKVITWSLRILQKNNDTVEGSSQLKGAFYSSIERFFNRRQKTPLRNNMDLNFWRNFWNLTETTVFKFGPKFTHPYVKVNKLITLRKDAINSYICRSDSEEAKYFYPLKSEVVVFRLVSHEWLFGQIFDEKHIKDYQTFINKYKPNFSQDKAENLIIHFHGGGFIAHSSLTSEAFLRDWAQMFKCPIVSVDYSLAPEKPYPAAIHDCFFVYIWLNVVRAPRNTCRTIMSIRCLQNFEKLGTLGRRVIFVGDSAGGSLVFFAATAFAASCCGIRVPDSVIPVYPVLLVKDLLSPSRCLSAIDPLLPPSVLILCLKSYAPHEDDNPFLSPILAPEELLSSLPKIRLAACEFDPLLDDSIEFAKKLYSCHTNFEFKVFRRGCHGFLNFLESSYSRECAGHIINWISEEFRPTTSS
ncbi:hormone-sensitive lipase-like isoform X3 [Zophobas morio]|uniref:hormone-sensitive lipase-like isoform X3 n=1 Tax=Zophobas morio TaxID=2755281 RepID=UPI003082C86A